MRETQFGSYYFVEQDDGNIVLYKFPTMQVLWDKWSHESIYPNNPIYPPSIPSQTKPKLIASKVNPIGMSYWRNINYHFGRDNLLVALSINNQLRVLTINKLSLMVEDDKSLGINHIGEGIYFSSSRHDILFVPLDGELWAVNVYTGDRALIWKLEGHKLWQIHSNMAETIYSATIRDLDYNNIGWGIFNGETTEIFPIDGMPDECQIDKSGEWLLIKEDDYNRIIHIPTGAQKKVSNKDGALGHSDCGFGFAIGENDYSSLPGALDLIDFNTLASRNMYSSGVWNLGYVSFTNARNEPLTEQFCLVTTPTDLIKVILDGSGAWFHICPNLTESQEYEHRPKANLCPLGQFAIWTAFVDGSLNAYIVKV